MRIAYMIAAHTDPIQLRRLVISLNGEDIEFFIHIDKKNDIQPFLRELNLENVHQDSYRKFYETFHKQYYDFLYHIKYKHHHF